MTAPYKDRYPGIRALVEQRRTIPLEIRLLALQSARRDQEHGPAVEELRAPHPLAPLRTPC